MAVICCAIVGGEMGAQGLAQSVLMKGGLMVYEICVYFLIVN